MTDENLEELIGELRDLKEEAGEMAAEQEQEVDMSEVKASHMALAEYQGMEQAFQQAWQLAIGKREEIADQ